MTIFLFLVIYLILIHFLVPESQKIKKSIIASFGFVLVLALRSPYCGLDVVGSTGDIGSMSYAGVFYRMVNYSFWEVLVNPGEIQSHMEVGWLLLTKVISFFTDDLQVFLTIIAIISFIPISYIFGKYSKKVVLSFFIFACLGFYIRYFSGIRQALAISIILLAFDQLYQKRYVWFASIVILASFIHRSSLFFLIMWPLSFLHLTAATSVIVLMIVVVLTPFYNRIVPWIIEFFFQSKYEHYVDSVGQAITMFFVYAIFLLVSFINKSKSRMIELLRMILLVGVIGQSLGVLSGGAITRIGFYFNVFLAILLPEMIDSFKDRTEQNFINVVAIVLLCTFFVLTQPAGEGSSNVIPYKFYWENPISYII